MDLKKKKNLSVASARENEVDGVSFFQQLPCIILFVLSLIFKLFRRASWGVVVHWLRPALAWWQAFRARGCHWSVQGEGDRGAGLHFDSPERQSDVGGCG